MEIKRRSPVFFPSRKAKREWRNGWEVTLRYHDEGKGPFLIDLSHQSKWDIQDTDLAMIQPMKIPIPEAPGQCRFQNGLLLNRMNRTQVAAWFLSKKHPAEMPRQLPYTDVTDAYILLALVGKEMFEIMEKVTALDLGDPRKKPPFLVQGPISHVPCQLVILGEKEGYFGAIIACSRGYAQSMVHALMDAGMEWGIRPAGEDIFLAYTESLSQ